MPSSSSSSKSAAEANLLGIKRKLGDDYVTKQFMTKHKKTSDEKTTKGLVESLQQNSDEANLIAAEAVDVREKTLLIANLYKNIRISNIIDFFKDVAQVVRVRIVLSVMGVTRCYGFVEFASAKDAKKAVEKKKGEFLLGREIHLRVAKNAPYPPQTKLCMDHKVCYRDLMEEDQAVERLDETSDCVEGVLFVANLSPQTRMLHIKKFFSSVGEVVSVRLIVNHEGKHVGYGFVEFASANEAKKALETKDGKYLHDHKIFLDVAKKAPYPPRPKYNLAEKLCYEDYLRRQNLVREEDKTAEGFEETPAFVEGVAVREKTLLVTCLSRRAKVSDIIDFFKDVGEVVHVRLIVDNMGKHVGYGFVEFASTDGAEKALEKKNGECLINCNIVLDVAKKSPYSPRPKYCIDHKVWYEDYLRRENFLIKEDEAEEGLDEIPDFLEEIAAKQKTIFVSDFPRKTKLPAIIHFFSRVGQIVCVQLIVDDKCENVGCAFVEFGSAGQAEEALEKKNGREFTLDVVETAPYPLRPKYSLAEKLWSKVESLQDDDQTLGGGTFDGKIQW